MIVAYRVWGAIDRYGQACGEKKRETETEKGYTLSESCDSRARALLRADIHPFFQQNFSSALHRVTWFSSSVHLSYANICTTILVGYKINILWSFKENAGCPNYGIFFFIFIKNLPFFQSFALALFWREKNLQIQLINIYLFFKFLSLQPFLNKKCVRIYSIENSIFHVEDLFFRWTKNFWDLIIFNIDTNKIKIENSQVLTTDVVQKNRKFSA